MVFDLLIHGGMLVDGTGSGRVRSDVGVAGQRIVALGALRGSEIEARHTIDASGMIVAPGFIDVHTHADGWLLTIPHLLPKTTQGFTSEVLMSDGISYAPVAQDNYRDWIFYLRGLNGLEQHDYQGWHSIADYMALLDRHAAQNVIAQIPYANVRVLAAGWSRGPLDDTQKKIIRHEIERAMDAGAVGLSTGLDYISECFASTDELVDACSAMASWRGIYATHVRYKLGTLAGVQEAVEIGRRAGVPVHISHLKASSPAETETILSYIDRVAVNEVDFSFDIYPYLPGSTLLSYLLPYDVWEQGPLAAAARLRQPAVRDRLATLLDCFQVTPERISLAWLPTKDGHRWQGLSLAQYAARTSRSPAHAVCDLLLDTNLAALTVLNNGSDELIEPFLQHPKFMLGTDGIYFADGLIHPRVYGSAPRMLGPLVRQRKLFSLEEAVRKMSSIPAERFGLTDRGVVRENAWADLVVFDPEQITDHSTYDNPHQLSTGIEHVIVNGVPIIALGEAAKASGPEWPGRALRFKA